MPAFGRPRGATALSVIVGAVVLLNSAWPAGTGVASSADRPHVLHDEVSEVLVRVRGATVCSGTPIVDTPLVVTAAHCILDAAGTVTAVTIERDGIDHTPREVLVDTRYHDDPRPALDAAVLIMDTPIPGPSATLGRAMPTAGTATLVGFQPLDTDGTLLRGTNPYDRPAPKGTTGGVIRIESSPAGCVVPTTAIAIAPTSLTVPCGLIPGASGGGLFTAHDGQLVLHGVTSTVAHDLSWNGLAAITLVDELLRHPDRYTHPVPDAGVRTNQQPPLRATSR